jgi:GNAT superfamily N-acetyltransferase
MTNDIPLLGPHLLTKFHQVDAFDCGVPILNEYLKKHALQNQLSQGARNYVITRGDHVIGYFTLAYGAVSSEEAPPRIQQGLGRHPIPVLILARLAVALNEKGQGLGKALLKQTLLKALQASEIAGLRAVLVHAKDNESKAFYLHYEFLPFPSNELTLYLLIKDIRKNLGVAMVHKETIEAIP